jgi:peptidoglycan/LPS O-acetylase OafA/YrhL
LAVEIVFYAALPLLVVPTYAIARRIARRETRVLALLAPPALLLAVGLSGKAVAAWVVKGTSVYGGYNADWHSVIERNFWAQADLFTFGMLVAVIAVEVADGRITLPRHWRRWALAAALPLFFACAATMQRAEHSYRLQNTGEAIALALLLAVIVVPHAADAQPLRAVRVLESRVFIAVGLASYSLFLWHLPIIYWLRDRGVLAGGLGGFFWDLAVVGLVAGAASALTYRVVEVPALRRKRSMRAD